MGPVVPAAAHHGSDLQAQLHVSHHPNGELPQDSGQQNRIRTVSVQQLEAVVG